MERNESEDDEENSEEEEDIKDILEMTKSINSFDGPVKEELMTYIVSLKRSVRKLSL